jgi:putative cardiolipin synthase
MKRHSSLEYIAACALVCALSACTSVPRDFEQVPSRSWQHPEQTRLGTFFDDHAPADRSLSGVRLLANPQDAFRARFGFASLAEKTLDLQYYLWKGKIVWTAEGPDGLETWRKEPGTSGWQRSKVMLMSWIPMEKEL